MADSRPLFIGPRLRRLRRELGLTQATMASDLDISASYVALLERNQRPVTADLLLRLARSYALDVSDLSSEDAEAYEKRIGDILRDPIFGEIDLPPLEIADLSVNFPGVSEALLRLYAAYVREQQALARLPGGDEAGANDPVAEARRFFTAHDNHYEALDREAEQVAGEIEKLGGLAEWIGQQGVRVRILPPRAMAGSLRRFDRHNQQLLLVDTLDAASRSFQLATHIAYTRLRPAIMRLVREAEFASETAETLVRRALAGYAAAAILMPYGRFLKVAQERGYDVLALSRVFGASFEQVAHRLASLRRKGEEGIGFFLLRVDQAGNVSKRLDLEGFPYPEHGGGCPLWSIHTVFRTPGELVTQWLEFPDGQRYFSLARTVRAGGGNHGAARLVRSLAIVCRARDADQMIYAQGVDSAQAQATPVGMTCRLCPRTDCIARSQPPIGREILADDYRRGSEPFAFTEI